MGMFKQAADTFRATVAAKAAEKGLECTVTVTLGEITEAPQYATVKCGHAEVRMEFSHVVFDPVKAGQRAVSILDEYQRAS